MARVSYGSCPIAGGPRLPGHPLYPALPTADPDRLRRFYEEVLGFTVRDENARTIYYGAGVGTFFALATCGGKPSGADKGRKGRAQNDRPVGDRAVGCQSEVDVSGR